MNYEYNNQTTILSNCCPSNVGKYGISKKAALCFCVHFLDSILK